MHFYLLKCKTVQKPSCFKTGFWITEYKTGEGDKPSKGGVWLCSLNKVLFWKLSKQKKSHFQGAKHFGSKTPYLH